jgi:hypothetical protein
MDLSAVITWVGLGLSVAEPHALRFFVMCQLDLEQESVCLGQYRDSAQEGMRPGTLLIQQSRLELRYPQQGIRGVLTVTMYVRTTRWLN